MMNNNKNYNNFEQQNRTNRIKFNIIQIKLINKMNKYNQRYKFNYKNIKYSQIISNQ